MAETDSLTSSIFYVFILLVIGVGLMVFLNPNPAPQPDQPQITQTEPEISPETLTPVGSFKINDLEITQYLESTPSGHAEVFAFSDSSPKAFLLIAPKSLAPKASDLILEGTSIKDVQVLESDPVLLVHLSGDTFKVYLTEKAAKAAGDSLAKSKQRFVLVPIREELDNTVLVLPRVELDRRTTVLRQMAARIRNLPEHAFNEQNFPELTRQLSAAAGQTDPVKAVELQIAKYSGELPVSQDDSGLRAAVEKLSRKPERRLINLGSFAQIGQEEFIVSGNTGGALLRFRLILPNSVPKLSNRPVFQFSDETERQVYAKVVSVSMPTPVPELSGYAHDVDVLVKFRESAIKGGRFPDAVLSGVLETNVFQVEGAAKRISVSIRVQESKPFIHAGYFLSIKTQEYPAGVSAVFVTNDAPYDLDVDVCGRTVRVPSKSGYVVPLKPAEKGTVALCAISQGGLKVDDLLIDRSNNVAPGVPSYFTPYDFDLSCPAVKSTFFNFLTAYGENAKTVDPEAYRALWGDEFTQVSLLRTQAVDGCSFAEPFDVIGLDEREPQKLEDGRVYVMTLRSNIALHPQLLSYLTLSPVLAENAALSALFNSANWKTKFVESDVT